MSQHGGKRASMARIPATVRERTQERILKYAKAHDAGKFTRLAIRFAGRCATSMPTPSLRRRRAGCFAPWARRASSTSGGRATFHSTCADSATLGTRRRGAWPFTPTAMSVTSRARSATAPSTARRRARSKWARLTFVRGEAFVRESLPEENGWIAGPVGGTMRPRTTR